MFAVGSEVCSDDVVDGAPRKRAAHDLAPDRPFRSAGSLKDEKTGHVGVPTQPASRFAPLGASATRTTSRPGDPSI